MMSVVPSAPTDTQRKSSLETEPRTLYEDQIAEAQNAAIDIIQTKDEEEALEIFTTPAVEVQPREAVHVRKDDPKDMVGNLISEKQTLPPTKLPSAPF